MYRSLLFSILFLTSLCLHALDFSKTDLSHLYSLGSPVDIRFQLVPSTADQTTYYLRVERRVQVTFDLSFFTQEKYTDATEAYVQPTSIDTLSHSERYTVLQCELATDSLDQIVVIQLVTGSQKYYFPIVMDVDRLSSFYPWKDGPVTTPFSEQAPEFREADSLYAYAYSMDFGLADPPFGVMRALSPEMSVDSIFSYDHTGDFQDWVFYFVQEDTASSKGSGFLKCPSYYPRYRTVEELVGPLQYICSSKEFEEVVTSPNLRSGFEDFWISTLGNQQEAKIAIRRYYRRVTGANQYFTNYKPGWKTDQGMIYVVFGAPQQVYRTGRKEIWMYGGGLQFEFIRISTLFSPTLYTLLRDPEYKEKWVQRIASIRQGS